jgi:multidrug efflux pump subunit AcrA (membrane-fusion protein)
MQQPEDALILPGMAGTARVDEIDLPEERQRTGVAVPVGAVFTPDTETQSHVWIIEPTEGDLGVLKRRPVKTGDMTRLGVLVTDGLTAGEWIVTAGVHSVDEGETVRILKQNGA